MDGDPVNLAVLIKCDTESRPEAPHAPQEQRGISCDPSGRRSSSADLRAPLHEDTEPLEIGGLRATSALGQARMATRRDIVGGRHVLAEGLRTGTVRREAVRALLDGLLWFSMTKVRT